MTLVHEKQALRERLRGELKSLPPGAQRAAGEAVARHLAAYLTELAAQEAMGERGPPVVAFFASLPWEIDTAPIDALLRELGFDRAVPSYATGHLRFHRLSPDTVLHSLPRDRLGIPTPPEAAPVLEAEQATLILTPGVALDGEGRRLGQGGGYYDAMLKRMRGHASERDASHPPVVALAFELQLVARVPAGSDDERVDGICTPERGLIWFPG